MTNKQGTKSNNIKKGKLFIFSGPSQVGKDSVVRILQKDSSLNLTHVITNTTRRRRPGEHNRIYINFLSEAEFQKLITGDKLLEWAVPYAGLGAKYGTAKKPVNQALAAGKNVILNIDTQGAFQVKNKIPEAVLIFITAESAQEVKRRIFSSTKMDLKAKKYRWQQASYELKEQVKYNHIIINRFGQLNETVKQAKEIIKSYLT